MGYFTSGDWIEVPNAYGVYYIPVYDQNGDEYCRVHHQVNAWDAATALTAKAAKKKFMKANRLAIVMTDWVQNQ